MKRQTLLSIFVIASCVTVLEATAIHGVQTATYQQAVDICSARRLSLASIEQLRHQLQLVPNNVQFWLPYRKSTSGDWRWIDGAFYANHIIDPAGSVAHQDCAVVQSSDRILDESYCFKPTKDFLCDLPGSCPHGQTCITIDNKIRSVHYGKFSWFKARDVCRNLGGDLATFHGKDMQLTIQSIHSALKAQGHFWIGLARKQWLSVSGEHPTYYNWTSNADDSLGCATISHDLVWRTEGCENQNAFICNVTKMEGSTVTEQTSIPVTAAKKRTGWETTAHRDKAAVSEIPPSSTLATGSVSAGSVVGIVLPLIIVALIAAGFLVIRYFQVTRKQKGPKNNRETMKKMFFYDKLCKRRSALTKPSNEEHDGMNKIEATSTNENLQEIEPSSRTPLMSECTEQHAVAVGEARSVTNINGSNKDDKLPVRKAPDQSDAGASKKSFNVKYGNQHETKPNLHIVKNGSKQPHEISDVARKTSVKPSKRFTSGSQDDSSKAQMDPHLHKRDNLNEQSKGSNIHETVKKTNMTDNSATPAPKDIKTHIKDLNLSQKDLAANKKPGVVVSTIQNFRSNLGQNSPPTVSSAMRQSTSSVPAASREENPISTGSSATTTNSERISPEFPALNEGRAIDSREESASTNREEVLTNPDQDPQTKDSNVNDKENANVKENKSTHKVDDIIPNIQDQTSKSNLGHSSFISVSSDSKRSKPSVPETREENSITLSSSVSASNSQRISRYPSCVNEDQTIDSKEKNYTRKDREEVATFHAANVINKKENEYNMLRDSPFEEGNKSKLPSTLLVQTGNPFHSNTTLETKREEKNISNLVKIKNQIKRQDGQEQQQDTCNSDLHAPASITSSHDVKDDLAKPSAQEFADLLSSNKDQILVEYAKNPDVFHQNIDTITAHLSNPSERPGLLLLLQQIVEYSPQVFLERHVRQVGSYISKDSGEYPVLTVLKYFPTRFPDIFEILDDAVIKLFEADGRKLFRQFPKLIGVLGSHSEKSARKYTDLLVKQIAVLPLPFKNNLLGCLARIAAHFKDVVLVHKDKFENIKHPLHEVAKNELLKVLGVKSESQTQLSAQGEQCQRNKVRTENEEEKEVIQGKGQECVEEREEIGKNEAQGEQEKPSDKPREQNVRKHENEGKTKQKEIKNFKPEVLVSATTKGPAPLPPDKKKPPARPQFLPGQSPNSTGGTDKQHSATDTLQSSVPPEETPLPPNAGDGL